MNPSLLAALLVGYLLGSIPFGLLLTRAAGLDDIRKIGSGSIGATNVLRTGRKGLAAATLLLDAGKGAAAVLIGHAVAGEPGVFAGGLAAVVGHLFPVWLRFRGGKGAATGLGVLIAASPPVGLASAAVWIAMLVLLRISSVATLTACLAAPVLAWALHAAPPVLVLALCGAVLIWLRHRANIERLWAGTEPRIGRG
jgi:glycerol-3-phosphate acyltransferase PlsY